MAELLTFNDLKKRTGSVVYEEWLYGTGTRPYQIISNVTDNVILLECPEDNERHCARRASREYRYWTEQPTDDQRELTEWH